MTNSNGLNTNNQDHDRQRRRCRGCGGEISSAEYETYQICPACGSDEIEVIDDGSQKSSSTEEPGFLLYNDSELNTKRVPTADAGQKYVAENNVISVNGRLYRYDNGVYRPGAERDIELWTQHGYDALAKKKDGQEVTYWVATERAVDPSELNPEPNINVFNGLLDRRTLELKPATPSNYFTWQLSTKWDPAAYHERGDEFLGEVLPDAGTRSVVEEIFGYCLIRDCRYQKAAMFVGTGMNAKSVLISWFTQTIGPENFSSVRLQELQDRFRTAQLVDKLANICADLPNASIADTGVFKMLVTGDELCAEYKFKDPFTFKNRAKLIFSCNEVPGTADRTDGYYRRWIIIPFLNRFSPEIEGFDPNILEKLVTPEGRSYLLRLAVEGLQRLEARGYFQETDMTRRAMAAFKRATDHVVSFYEDRCEYDGGDAHVAKNELFASYNWWCHVHNYRPLTEQKFSSRLRAIEPRITTSRKRIEGARKRVWLGLKLHKEDVQR